MYMPREERYFFKKGKKKEELKEIKSMEKRITIREWIINFLMEEYTKEDVQTQIKAGWWDWFFS